MVDSLENTVLRLCDFNYALPEELIAQFPLEQRDASRLLVTNVPRGTLTDERIANLPQVLRGLFPSAPSILCVRNNSKVYPARVRIRKASGARGEVFLLETGDKDAYRCLLRPQKKLKVGETLYLDSDELRPLFEVTSLEPPRVRPLGMTLAALLDTYGEMPLPPYIERDPKKVGEGAFTNLDKSRYQTVYSQTVGSSAAPTAGLHFTEKLLSGCAAVGVEFVDVTLHVGLGTFQPVQSDNIDEHVMHSEHFFVGRDVARTLHRAVNEKLPIVFVGTTALRSVESFVRRVEEHGRGLEETSFEELSETWHATDLFLRPRTRDERVLPRIGNALLTNFHQPQSTLVMLVAALCGYDFWSAMYAHAFSQRYRFLSYGDSSLVYFKDV